MDLSKVVKDENLRQQLIEEQYGDGNYNPETGVYKWGEVVYDLTKSNGEAGLGWLPIKSKIIKYTRNDSSEM